jgi:hypothetical protein
MLILAIIALLIGFVLGLRFRVYVLIPAIGSAWAVVAVAGNVDGVGQLVGAMVFVATFFQLGYLGGVILRRLPNAADRGTRPSRFGTNKR